MNAAELEGRRKGALKGILSSPESARGYAADRAKVEALFQIAEQLAALNEKLTPARVGAAGKIDWKRRRVAACIRQEDVARRVGLTVARYGGIERGEIKASDEERRSIEAVLPPLPQAALDKKESEATA